MASEAPYNEPATADQSAEVIRPDDTSWREARRKAWLRVAVVAMMTVFTIAHNRPGQVAGAVLGPHEGPVAVNIIAARRRHHRCIIISNS